MLKKLKEWFATKLVAPLARSSKSCLAAVANNPFVWLIFHIILVALVALIGIVGLTLLFFLFIVGLDNKIFRVLYDTEKASNKKLAAEGLRGSGGGVGVSGDTTDWPVETAMAGDGCKADDR